MAKKYIRSVAFPDSYLTLDGRSVTSWQKSGSGAVYCMNQGSAWEYVDLEDIGNGMHAIKSSAFNNVYLRMYAKDLKGDGGEVNLQYGWGDLEKFFLRSIGGNRYRIESAYYRDCFLRMHATSRSNGRGFGWVNAAKGAREWEEFEILDPPAALTAGEVHGAIAKYGPELRFHKDERFLMCSVEWLLSQSTLKSDRGVVIRSPTVADLPIDDSKGTYWLEIDAAGKNGKPETAKAYVRCVYGRNDTFTDLQFWFCYGFNGPGKVTLKLKTPFGSAFDKDFSVEPVGEHFGDWECGMVRIDNFKKNMIGVWMSQHSSGQYLNSFGVAGLGKNGSAPVIYASHNGHAVFPFVGANVTEGVDESKLGFGIRAGLVNNCNGEGRSLDCRTKYEVVSTTWLGEEFREPRWVKYPFRWGPDDKRPYDVGPIVDKLIGWIPSVFRVDFIEGNIKKLMHWVTGVIGDNMDGPSGPAQKDQWHGRYS